MTILEQILHMHKKENRVQNEKKKLVKQLLCDVDDKRRDDTYTITINIYDLKKVT